MKPVAPGDLLLTHCRALAAEEAKLREGGGAAGQERQHKLGRLFVRVALPAPEVVSFNR